MSIISEYIGFVRYTDIYKNFFSKESYFLKFIDLADNYNLSLHFDVLSQAEQFDSLHTLFDEYKSYLADKIASGEVEIKTSKNPRLYIFCLNLSFFLRDKLEKKICQLMFRTLTNPFCVGTMII